MDEGHTHVEGEVCHDEHAPFNVGDKITYKGETGTVTRTTILGFKPCCSIKINWDDTTKKAKILQMHELCDCVKC